MTNTFVMEGQVGDKYFCHGGTSWRQILLSWRDKLATNTFVMEGQVGDKYFGHGGTSW